MCTSCVLLKTEVENLIRVARDGIVARRVGMEGGRVGMEGMDFAEAEQKNEGKREDKITMPMLS